MSPCLDAEGYSQLQRITFRNARDSGFSCLPRIACESSLQEQRLTNQRHSHHASACLNDRGGLLNKPSRFEVHKPITRNLFLLLKSYFVLHTPSLIFSYHNLNQKQSSCLQVCRPETLWNVSEADRSTAQKRLGQVSGHLAGSKSGISPTAGGSGRAALLQKSPDDVRTPIPQS
jgi:hypothetical protein